MIPLNSLGHICWSFASRSEVQRQLRHECARGYVVRAAEGGKEVIERVLVGYIDRRQVEVELVLVGVEEVVLTEVDVEQVAWSNARRVAIVGGSVGRGNAQEGRSELIGRANGGQCEKRRGALAGTFESSLE